MFGARGCLLLATAILAGCREDPEPVRAEGGRVTVAQVDFRFRPQAIRARPGRQQWTVVNRGRLAHSLRVVDDDADPDAGEPRTFLTVRTQKAGGRTVVTRRIGVGTYRYVCAIGNHEELGMWGTLVVR